MRLFGAVLREGFSEKENPESSGSVVQKRPAAAGNRPVSPGNYRPTARTLVLISCLVGVGCADGLPDLQRASEETPMALTRELTHDPPPSAMPMPSTASPAVSPGSPPAAPGAALLTARSVEGSMASIVDGEESFCLPARSTDVRYLALDEGDFLYVVVEQQNLDVVLRLVGPETPGRPRVPPSAPESGEGRGPEIDLELDSPNGSWGKEELLAIVPASGSYRLEVMNESSGEGAYVLRRLLSGPPSERDLEHRKADQEYRRGLEERSNRQMAASLEAFSAARARFQQLGLADREGRCLWEMGFVHRREKRDEAAREVWEQALDRFRLFEDRSLRLVLLELGKLSSRLDDPRATVSYLSEARTLFAESEERDREAQALQHLGNAFRRLGRLQEASDAFDRGAELAKLGLSPRVEAFLALDRGNLELALRRPRRAFDSLEHAERLFARLGKARDRSRAHYRLASAGLLMGDLDRAEREAWASLEVLGGQPAPRQYLASFGILAHALRQRGDLDGAEHTYGRAVELARQVKDLRSESTMLTGLAMVHLGAGRASSALAYQMEGLAAARALGSAGPREQSICEARAAQIFLHLDRLDEAQSHMERALELVERVRASSDRQDLRLSYFGSRREYYDIAVDILVRLHAEQPGAGHAARALQLHDGRLARELLESVGLDRSRNRLAEAGQPQLFTRLSELEAELAALAQSPPAAAETGGAGSGSSRQAHSGGSRASEVLDSLHRLRGHLRSVADRDRLATIARTGVADFGLDADSGTNPDSVLDTEALQKELSSGGSLALVLSLGADGSHLFELGSGPLKVHPLPPRRDLESLADELEKAWGETHLQSRRRAATLARELSQRLFEPLGERLQAAQRLLVVADGGLVNLPFSALPWPTSSDQALGDSPPMLLIDHLELVQLPSLSAALQRRQTLSAAVSASHAASTVSTTTSAAPRPHLAIFADPVYGSDDARVSSATGQAEPAVSLARRRGTTGEPSALATTSLPRLPASAEEARALEELLEPGSVRSHLGFEATREAFLEGSWEGIRILHVASHAVAHRQVEMSGLVLSTVDTEGRVRSGFVTGMEIAHMRLPVDLVVLSGCDTAIGGERLDESALGLAWSFLQAGARGVVASLWKVDDARTAQLMSELYRALLHEELTPAAALRKAQLSLRQSLEAAAFESVDQRREPGLRSLEEEADSHGIPIQSRYSQSRPIQSRPIQSRYSQSSSTAVAELAAAKGRLGASPNDWAGFIYLGDWRVADLGPN